MQNSGTALDVLAQPRKGRQRTLRRIGQAILRTGCRGNKQLRALDKILGLESQGGHSLSVLHTHPRNASHAESFVGKRDTPATDLGADEHIVAEVRKVVLGVACERSCL